MISVFALSSNILKTASSEFRVYHSDRGGIFDLDGLNQVFETVRSQNWIHSFILHLSQKLSVNTELLETLSDPILFRFANSSVNTTSLGLFAADVEQACQIIIIAKQKGFLYASEMHYASIAQNILDITNVTTLDSAISEASGFELHKLNHKIALSEYLFAQTKKNYVKWVISLSDGYYTFLLNMLGKTWSDLNTDPESIASEILATVFARIDVKLLHILSQTKPRMKYKKQYRPEKYLAHPELEKHLVAVENIAQLADYNSTIFKQLLDKALPIQNEFVIKTLTPKENPIPEEFIDLVPVIRTGLNTDLG